MIFGEYQAGAYGNAVIPTLPAISLRDTAAFYAALGFETKLFEDGEGYLIVRRDWVEFHFYAAPETDPKTTAATCYLRVSDVDAVFAALSPLLPANGRLTSPVDRAWGLREAYLFDPSGTLIRIGSRLPSEASPS